MIGNMSGSMIGSESAVLEVAAIITATFLFLGGVMGVIRLLRGPYLVDRIVALDYISFVAVATLVMFTLCFAQNRYLDVAIVLALLAFLATVAFARYAWRRQQQGAGLEEMDD